MEGVADLEPAVGTDWDATATWDTPACQLTLHQAAGTLTAGFFTPWGAHIPLAGAITPRSTATTLTGSAPGAGPGGETVLAFFEISWFVPGTIDMQPRELSFPYLAPGLPTASRSTRLNMSTVAGHPWPLSWDAREGFPWNNPDHVRGQVRPSWYPSFGSLYGSAVWAPWPGWW